MFTWDVILVSVISLFILSVILCASPEGTSFSSKLNRFLIFTVPDSCYALLLNTLGESAISKIKYYSLYLFIKPNPFFQLVYLGLSLGGFAVFINYGFPFIPNPFVPSIHMYFGSVLYLVTLTTFILACITPPGQVTKSNLSFYLSAYQYDNVMFKPSDCTHCKIQKPARSKHCKICGHCVGKIDHHCIWINQCVGYQNYRFFLAFVISHSLICIYAGQIGFLIFCHIIQKDRLWSIVVLDSNRQRMEIGYFTMFQLLLHKHTALMFVVIICIVMGLTLLGFFVYNFYLACQNITGIEKQKQLKLESKDIQYTNIYNKGVLQNLTEVIDAEIPNNSS